MKGRTLAATLTLVLTTLQISPAISADYDAVQAKLENAMAAEIRTPAEIERDANRKPIETLEFFGLRDDMKVVELFSHHILWVLDQLLKVLM